MEKNLAKYMCIIYPRNSHLLTQKKSEKLLVGATTARLSDKYLDRISMKGGTLVIVIVMRIELT